MSTNGIIFDERDTQELHISDGGTSPTNNVYNSDNPRVTIPYNAINISDGGTSPTINTWDNSANSSDWTWAIREYYQPSDVSIGSIYYDELSPIITDEIEMNITYWYFDGEKWIKTYLYFDGEKWIKENNHRKILDLKLPDKLFEL